MTENIPTLSLELPVNYDAFIERDKGLKDLGIQFKKEYFQKRYDLDEADFDVSEQKENPFNPSPEALLRDDPLRRDETFLEQFQALKKKVENPFF